VAKHLSIPLIIIVAVGVIAPGLPAGSGSAEDGIEACCADHGGLAYCTAAGVLRCMDATVAQDCPCTIGLAEKKPGREDDDFEPMLDGESLSGFESWEGPWEGR